MNKTKKLELCYLEQHQISKEIIINENWNRIDRMLPLFVIDILNNPPSDPSDGDLFIVGCTPVETWTGKRYNLALYSSNSQQWKFWSIANNSVLFIISHREWYTFKNESMHVVEKKIVTILAGQNRCICCT